MQLEIVEDNIKTFILPLYLDFPVSEKAIANRIVKENKKRETKKLKKDEKRKGPVTTMRPFDRYWFNLNNYRNWHSRVEWLIKKQFTPLEVPPFFTAKKIKITYSIERISTVLYDTWNIDHIVDKYFCDWLVKNEYIPDDNYEVVSHGETIPDRGNFSDRVIAKVEILL